MKKTTEGKGIKLELENLGEDELWCYWFRCPKCKDENVRKYLRFCPNCGFDLIDYKNDLEL